MGAKYPVLTPEKIIRALAKAGFVLKSQRGSHAKYVSDRRVVIIPMHDKVAMGTLRSILTQADIPLDVFLELL